MYSFQCKALQSIQNSHTSSEFWPDQLAAACNMSRTTHTPLHGIKTPCDCKSDAAVEAEEMKGQGAVVCLTTRSHADHHRMLVLHEETGVIIWDLRSVVTSPLPSNWLLVQACSAAAAAVAYNPIHFIPTQLLALCSVAPKIQRKDSAIDHGSWKRTIEPVTPVTLTCLRYINL